jgi:hypothetical protein
MKKSKQYLTFIFFVSCFVMNAQVGIGTNSPENSAVLDLTSKTKGLLPPRMTQSERDSISLPAKGLIIYNTTKNALDINNGTPETKAWDGIAGGSGSGSSATYFTANAANDIRTTVKNDTIVPGMSITPGAGTYAVSFNGQYHSALFNYNVNITEQGKLDLATVYNTLYNTPTTVLGHGTVFGSETLTAGVYSVEGATNLAGTLILNAQLNPSSVFIFKVNGALTSSAGAKVVLANAASACNVFWVVEGAANFAAATEMQGLILGNNGAVTFAAGSSLTGRMFSTRGAVVTDSTTITIPYDCTYVDLGVLSTFAMYSSEGAITNTAASHITGNLGTNEGAISGFPGSGTHDGIIYSRSSPEVNIEKNVLSTFSVFQNDILVPNSSRTRRSKTPTFDVSLQAIATVVDGESINIRWKTDASELQLQNRIMTLVKVQ